MAALPEIDALTHDHVFLDEHGTKLTSGRELARLISKFKAFFPIDKDWGCHSLRHSFAFNAL